MSTNSLKAHKKVASVEVNDAGKATRLTLKAPWLYDGRRGPFDLKSVNHGHQITKAAYHEDKGPKAPKPLSPAPDAPTAPVIRNPFGQSHTEDTKPEPFRIVTLPPLEQPDRPFFLWRAVAQSDTQDIMFFFYTYRHRPVSDLEAEGRKMLGRMLRKGPHGDPSSYDIYIRRYTDADEAKRPSPYHEARKELGEP